MASNDQPPSAEAIQSQFDLAIALTLAMWPALTLAVANNWGGPASSDKRDWFAGAISDLFISNPATDLEDVETVLLQVMLDEFEVNVDDESAFEVAEEIMRLRAFCLKGEFAEVQSRRERWEHMGRDKAAARFQKVEVGEDDQDTDGDSMDEESEDDDDVEMADAPLPREKSAPEIDEDGFTKVVGRKKR